MKLLMATAALVACRGSVLSAPASFGSQAESSVGDCLTQRQSLPQTYSKRPR